MADKISELEKRLDRLEDKMKASFFEVEKRFEKLKIEEPPLVVIEQKIQELEDLLLLLQLEVTKLKDVTGSGMEFGSPQGGHDVYTRIRKIEEEIEALKHRKPERLSAEAPSATSVSRQLDEIEQRLEKIEKQREVSSGVLEDVRKILHA